MGRLRNNVAGQGQYQVITFGDGDKDIRRNSASARVIPAQQNLHAAALPGA